MARYDAFVSYTHADEGEVAKRLQAGVEKFGKPWYRTRSLRLFLDTNSLTASPGLWSSIEGALADSRWLILVTSPRAVESPWIDREIRWWLDNRSASTMLIVVADGTLKWDPKAGDFDSEVSTALPPALLGAFEEEPHWVSIPSATEPSELELRVAIVDIATPLRGVSKEKLVAAAEQERRRTMRWVRGVILTLSALLIAAVAAGLIALNQRSAAISQANLALSREVASASETVAGTNLSVAMLLAVQAYRMDANAQTRAALFGADTTSPNLVRFLDAGGEVKQLAGSANGRSALAALADGRVLLWESTDGSAKQLFRLPRTPSSIAISSDGSVAAASDPSRCLLWRRGRAVMRLPVPTGLHCDAVALSPSGKTVVYHGTAPIGGAFESITVAPVDHPDRGVVHRDPFGTTTRIIVPSDDRALLVAGGAVMWRRFSDWRGAERNVGAGAHDYEQAVSGDGRLFIVSNGSTPVPIMRTTGSSDISTPDFKVDVPLPNQKSVTLSPDGSELAVAGPGEIYVAPVSPSQKATVEPDEGRSVLSGQDAELVAFAGDAHLLSAAGNQIAVWDTNQLDRLARSETVPLEAACELCGPSKVSISPDGERVAVVNDNGTGGFLESLEGKVAREKLPEEFESRYGNPVWQGDGEFVAIPVWSPSGGTSGPVPNTESMPPDVRTWPVDMGTSEEYELTNGPSADGDGAILVDTTGIVTQQQVESGEPTGTSSDPSASHAGEGQASSAAISSSGKLLAIAYEDGVHVEELPSRRLVSRIGTSGYGTVAFAGDHLLVQSTTGGLEVWNENGRKRQQVIGGAGTGWLTGSPDGTTAAVSSSEDGTIRLIDLESGGEVATLQTPGGSAHLKTGLAFSPDGDRLVAVSELFGKSYTAELVSRDISDASLVRTACAAAGHQLTAVEWQAFVGTNPPDDLACR
jgi:WD40 repeat protein